MVLILCILLLPVLVSSRKYSEQELLHRLPHLLHLDDYNRCLTNRDGLYCLGSFELTPTKYPHPIYEFMQEYSSDTLHRFNRTRIHRGYCVSSRCPTHTDDEDGDASLRIERHASLRIVRNASQRFERCVADWTRQFSLQSTLYSLQYCRTHADIGKAHIPDFPELIFLYIIIAIILLNVIGTVYDSCKKDDSKSSILSTWSIPANWKRLVNTIEGEDSRLNDLLPTHGFKAIPVFLALLVHVYGGFLHLVTLEPHKREDAPRWLNPALATLASFLTSYNLLLLSEKVRLSARMLPLCLLKRIVRLAPLFLLMTGFMATWWVHVRDGPLWSPTIANERNVCRSKYWSIVFFVSNFIEADNLCSLGSWTLVVDVQLSIICCFLTLTLARLRRRALPILIALFFLSCCSNSILAYIFEWLPFREFGTSPELVYKLYHGVPSITNYYSMFWSSLPSSLIGVFLAHLHYELQRGNFNAADHKWLVIGTTSAIPILVTLIIMVSRVEGQMSRLLAALFIGIEYPLISAIPAFAFYGAIAFKGFNYNFFSWRGFHMLGRLTLPLAMISWMVHMTIAASRPHPNLSSRMDLYVDVAATYILTFLISIPVTVLVEIPMRRFLDTLIFSSYIQKHASIKAVNSVQDTEEVCLTSKNENVKNKVL